jgi:hypothetical protein
MKRRFLCLITIPIAACVAYRPQPVELAAVADEVDARTVQALDFASAVAYARANSPELKSLAAQARAAGFDVPPVNVVAGTNLSGDHGAITTDPVALLKLGPRGAAAKLADARQAEILTALAQEERRIGAAVAEAFLLERTLRGLQVPHIDVNAASFHAAGLASDVDRDRVRAARLAQRAETRTIEAEREANLARLRALLGLGSGARLELVLPEGAFPALPEPTRRNLLQRPDLAVALARYKTADAALKKAVADQYPSIVIGGTLEFDGTHFGGVGAIRVPLGAGKPARAAIERREAARLQVEAVLLQAQQEAGERAAEYDAAQARAAATAAAAQVTASALRSSLVRLEVTPDAFRDAAQNANKAVFAAGLAREAAVQEARARVGLASAYGWPFPEEIR